MSISNLSHRIADHKYPTNKTHSSYALSIQGDSELREKFQYQHTQNVSRNLVCS